MSICKDIQGACSLPNLNDFDIKMILVQIKREMNELKKDTTFKLLQQDNKINELCNYIKDHLSATLMSLIDAMKLSGELDKLIMDALGGYETRLDYIECGNQYVNLKQLGCKCDGVTDDTEKLEKALKLYSECNKIIVTGPCTIKISKTIVTDKPIVWIGKETKIITDNNSPAFDFRSSQYLHLEGLESESMLLINYGSEEATKESQREIFLKDIKMTANNGEPINWGMYISNKKPASYQDNGNGAYSRYGLEINNFSGYNALMIENRSVDDKGNIINGAPDNSAIGILDKVKGVASPSFLIDGGLRDFIGFNNYSASNKGTKHNGRVFEIGATGNVSIGTSTLNDEDNMTGSYTLKAISDYPSIVLKNSNTNDKVGYFIVDGKVVIAKVNEDDNNSSTSLLTIDVNSKKMEVKNIKTEGSSTSPSIIMKNGEKLKALFVDSEGWPRIASYEYNTLEKDCPIIQTCKSGNSNERPNLTNTIGNRGYMMFDRTLNKPIWWNGDRWVDATGTSV